MILIESAITMKKKKHSQSAKLALGVERSFHLLHRKINLDYKEKSECR